jgi:hypothetical protein
MTPKTALQPTATVPAVSIMFVFIDCPFGRVSLARGRGSALDRWPHYTIK